MELSILYRGPLASCNYGCPYCPFAKHAETAAEHATDAAALERFIQWVESRTQDQIAIFFTPWGEALIRKRYQRAIARLTRLPHVSKVAIQTNASCRFDWIEACDKTRLGLWVTYHPGEVTFERFIEQCRELAQRNARYSVGVVGLKEHIPAIQALRRELPAHIYVWVNAYKRTPAYYAADELQMLAAIDPLFPINNQYHPSFGRNCRAGHSVIAVNGEGTITRCHFIKTPIGNIYEPGFEAALQATPCVNATCGCHIGYVHLHDLQLYPVFGEGVLERIPAQALWQGGPR